MSLSALEIENRVTRLLESRMHNSGQLQGLDDQELAGIGKALKKVAKKVTKVVKKVAPIALGAGAIYLGAKVIGGAIKAKPKAGAAASTVANVAAPVAAAALQQAVSSGAVAPVPTAGTQLIDTAGQVATALISAQGLPSAANDPGIQQIVRDSIAAEMQQQQYAPQQSYSGGYVSAPKSAPSSFYDELPEVQVTADRLKPYLIPGAIGAGLLLLMAMNSNKRKG